MNRPFLGQTTKRFLVSAWFVFSVILTTVSVTAQPGEPPETVWVRTTNWVPRHLTNVIRISVPTNIFFNEYHTNWVQQKITNVVEVFRTNVLIAYRTNLTTLSVTNWETVLATRTNRVNVPVSVGVPDRTPRRAAAMPAKPEPTVITGERSTTMEFELTHTGKPLKPDQFPIRLVLKSTDSSSAGILPVQEWRVEKENGGVFLIASRTDFTGELPVGVYNVTARLPVAGGTQNNVRGQLEIKSDGSSQRSAAFVSPVR
jgi:hypothetical protein